MMAAGLPGNNMPWRETRYLVPDHAAYAAGRQLPHGARGAGIRGVCVVPPQPTGCAKPAVSRLAAGRGRALMLPFAGFHYQRVAFAYHICLP
jgi:hypothetical protein